MYMQILWMTIIDLILLYITCISLFYNSYNFVANKIMMCIPRVKYRAYLMYKRVSK